MSFLREPFKRLCALLRVCAPAFGDRVSSAIFFWKQPCSGPCCHGRGMRKAVYYLLRWRAHTAYPRRASLNPRSASEKCFIVCFFDLQSSTSCFCMQKLEGKKPCSPNLTSNMFRGHKTQLPGHQPLSKAYGIFRATCHGRSQGKSWTGVRKGDGLQLARAKFLSCEQLTAHIKELGGHWGLGPEH